MDTVTVIGGGIAGLFTACELSKQDKKVIILEAADRLGGRIHTYTDDSFSMPVELGAEFIHGKLPLTLALLKKAGIRYSAVEGNMVHFKNGKITKGEDHNDHWNEVIKQMKALQHDMPLSDFLIRYFNDDKYTDLKNSVKGFAEGFDLADVSKVSTYFLYNEWSHEENKSYRVEGGYGRLINYLESECRKNGCVIYTNCCVKKINWQKNEVNINTLCSRYFKSEKAFITVPLSVFQSNKNDINYIEFMPAIDDYLNAANRIGFGTVIKVLLEFDEAFWVKEKNNIGFILTSEIIPTWWTQFPNNNAILTGWLGGLNAIQYKDEPDEEILTSALQSLSNAFNIPVDILQKKLSAHKIVNWINVAYVNGGYSYNMVGSEDAKKLLQQPIEETIFFAGEATYEGASEGTVESALVSGKQASIKVSGKAN